MARIPANAGAKLASAELAARYSLNPDLAGRLAGIDALTDALISG